MRTLLPKLLRRILFTTLFLIPVIAMLEIPVFVAGAALGTYLVYSKDLPDVPYLASYQPKTVSTFYADDGTVIGVFYKERRFVVDLEQIPQHVINAFLAAEDSRFFEHTGVDWQSIARATVNNLKAGRIVQGGSTITMQVTRNFLLTRERNFSRKIKEMMLAYKVDELWGKKKVLHVYLNEIYLGEGCYGVESAARGYFGKAVEHLNVAEAALIAGLVANPARLNPFKSEELARRRQETVLGRMLKFGFISQSEYEQAKNLKLDVRKELVRPFDLVPDFAEAVRRYIVAKYGAEKLLNEGLKVFTTCRIDYQQKAIEAMSKGLQELRSRQKNLAILRTVARDRMSELLQNRRTPNLTEGKIYQGLVTKVSRGKEQTDIHVALSRQLKGIVNLKSAQAAAYDVGQVLAIRFVHFNGDTPVFTLDDKPVLQGALVSIENNTGYVRALVGGSTGEHFKFNRAIQAVRQPGSAFKPVIYAAAIEKKSYSPATIIIDEEIVVDLGETQDPGWETRNTPGQPPGRTPSRAPDRQPAEWTPRNAGGEFLGPVSVRTALEMSRNICTVKVLMDVGFDPVKDMAKKMGITAELGRNLSMSLGSVEMSPFEVTAAYTVFPNGGIYLEPVLVKRVEDRFGNVLEDNTRVPTLDPAQIPQPVPRQEFQYLAKHGGLKPDESDEPEEEQDQPQFSDDRSGDDEGPIALYSKHFKRRIRPAMSPQTAYVMTSILQGGLQRGTGAGVRRILNRKDLAGKTGTTNNSEDTWFVGFNPKLTTGVWVGFDEKRPLGQKEAGARAALPIWAYFMKDVLDKTPEKEFPVPPEIVFEEMTTYVGNPQRGFVPGTVTEPVYAPFAGMTLVLCPMDEPENLQEYTQPGLAQPPYGSPFPGQLAQPHQTPYPPVYVRPNPYQEATRPPQYPMHGGNVPYYQPQPGAQPPVSGPSGPAIDPGRHQRPAQGYPPGQSYTNPPTRTPQVQQTPPQGSVPLYPPGSHGPTVDAPQLQNLDQRPDLRPYYPQRR